MRPVFSGLKMCKTSFWSLFKICRTVVRLAPTSHASFQIDLEGSRSLATFTLLMIWGLPLIFFSHCFNYCGSAQTLLLRNFKIRDKLFFFLVGVFRFPKYSLNLRCVSRMICCLSINYKLYFFLCTEPRHDWWRVMCTPLKCPKRVLSNFVLNHWLNELARPLDKKQMRYIFNFDLVENHIKMRKYKWKMVA